MKFKAQFTDCFHYDRDFQKGDLVQVVVKSNDPKIEGVWGGKVAKITNKAYKVNISLDKEKGYGFTVRIPKDQQILPFVMFCDDSERYESWSC